MSHKFSVNNSTVAPIRGISGVAFRCDRQDAVFVYRTWMKPLSRKPDAGRSDLCQIYIDVHPDVIAPHKWGKKTLRATWKVTLRNTGRLTSECTSHGSETDEELNLQGAAIGWYNNEVLSKEADRQRCGDPLWNTLLGMINACHDKQHLESLPSVPQLRSLYRTCVGMTGQTYPSKGDMVSTLNGLGQSQYSFGGGIGVGAFHTAIPCVERAFDTSAQDPLVTDEPQASGAVDVDSLTNKELVKLAQESASTKSRYDEVASNYEQSVSRNTRLSEDILTAESAAADAASEVARLQGEVDALKRVTIQAKPATVSADGSTVDVLGVTLPRYGCDAAPAIDPDYDLTGWRAAMSVGGTNFDANAAQVAKAIIDGDSVRLIGPPSVGKTSGIRQVAAQCGARFFLIQCGEGANDLTLIGQHTVSEGSMVWQDGSITAAVRWAAANPDILTLAILDEVDHLQPEVQSLLHGVLEGDLLQFNGEELQIPTNVRFVATANTSGFGDTTGRHSAAKISDSAFTSRWNVTFDVTYLPPEAEARVLIKAGAPADLATMAVAVANETRVDGASVSQPIVLRQLLSWSRGCLNGEDPAWAWAWRVLAATPEHDRPAVWELTKLKFGW